MYCIWLAAALLGSGTADAGEVEHGISLSAGPSRIADYWWYEPGFSLLLGYERRFVGAFGGFIGYRAAYGISRTRLFGALIDGEYLPWGEADFVFGMHLPYGREGLVAAVGLGTDIAAYLPTPPAFSVRIGARGAIQEPRVFEVMLYLRGMVLPVPYGEAFPGMARWSSGLEASIRW